MLYPRTVYTDVNGLLCKTHLVVGTVRPPGSANYLVGLGEDGGRNGQAEGLGRIEVNDNCKVARSMGRSGYVRDTCSW